VRAAVTPVVQCPHAYLGDGKYAIALGDAHVTVDPLLAQGANIGSSSAFARAEAIEEADAFDLRFFEDVERRRAARIHGASCWTNAFLQPPDAARIELMTAMSRDRRLAQEYFENFSRPERQWERVGSAERIRDWLEETRMHNLQLAAVTADSFPSSGQQSVRFWSGH
jgi:2-polyprenyl-6-methoxyphenol hydroxylase-like FAD-dependent oxidoreductase